MAHSTFWWLLAGGLVVVELLTGGTFYLLMAAIGVVAGALAAHAGLSLPMQFVAVALVGSATVIAWHVYRRKRAPQQLPASSNRDVNLDIGESVHVDAWQADGTALVRYRGAQWTAQHRAGVIPAPGPHRVGEVVGNRLVLDRI
ncbi:MAG: NfeD family protein [Burkholderiales bacterium]|jgi:membrane protein implicated in regulation of membrane protease activity|nr:NfeD family protein [Burkholderiales bacterium]